MLMFEKIKEILSGKQTIKGIEIKRSAIEKFTEFSKGSYPKEFLGFSEGKIERGKILIDDILFQPYIANENSAFSTRLWDMPITANVVGSAHSHPGPSNHPSRADLHFFGKTGIVHMIIKLPYRTEDVALYDNNGNVLNYKIIE